jgi:hypothetical protein
MKFNSNNQIQTPLLFLAPPQSRQQLMDSTDDDILMASAHPNALNGPQGDGQAKEDLGDMTFCMSNYAKESLKMMYMMRQVSGRTWRSD